MDPFEGGGGLWAKHLPICIVLKLLSYNNKYLYINILKFVDIDLVGPLCEVNGKKYIVTAICYFSKYVEAQAISSKSTTEIADYLFSLICQYGIFQQVHSD